MFKIGWKEGVQAEILMKDMDGDILQQLVENCYTGEIEIGSENVDKLASAATMLQFTEVQRHCTSFYTAILEASNCLGIREVADAHNMVQLKERAHAFVLDHFMEVYTGHEFHNLSSHQLSELLQDDEINIAEEEDVFAALMGWAKHDMDNRKPSLPSLFRCIRFQHMKDSVSIELGNPIIFPCLRRRV